MKHLIKIVMTDPAETGDPTGIVGIQGNLATRQVHVLLAKQITDKDKKLRLFNTFSFLSKVRDTIKPDFMGMEGNNDGKEIIKKLQSKGLILKKITTSSNLTDKTTRRGFAMDKPKMVDWLKKQKIKHNILFPPETKGDMEELIDQIPQIVSIRTLTGGTSHRAQRGRHDDLFMALLLCCHVFLLYLARWDSLS